MQKRCLIFVWNLQQFSQCVIILMPKSVVTDTGKNTVAEAALLSHKSSDFYYFSPFLAYKLMEKLIEIMEDDDDVQNIWHNWEE